MLNEPPGISTIVKEMPSPLPFTVLVEIAVVVSEIMVEVVSCTDEVDVVSEIMVEVVSCTDEVDVVSETVEVVVVGLPGRSQSHPVNDKTNKVMAPSANLNKYIFFILVRSLKIYGFL
jgi:hypothetical protein